MLSKSVSHAGHGAERRLHADPRERPSLKLLVLAPVKRTYEASQLTREHASFDNLNVSSTDEWIGDVAHK